ncbi:MAG: type II toxin-antitoxin system RelE/ParE family toxin [bacterium]|nr:type II toxin-antitoxin system RelE/ParE family toxin [bacterium]
MKRIEKLENENYYGDCKSVVAGIKELRFHFGSGYKLYFTKYNNKIILLLCGGDKNSQSKDIKKAQELLAEALK